MVRFGAAPSDLRTQSALETLFDYFSNTAVSPMQKDFILCEHPLASSAHFHVSEQVSCSIFDNTNNFYFLDYEHNSSQFWGCSSRQIDRGQDKVSPFDSF